MGYHHEFYDFDDAEVCQDAFCDECGSPYDTDSFSHAFGVSRQTYCINPFCNGSETKDCAVCGNALRYVCGEFSPCEECDESISSSFNWDGEQGVWVKHKSLNPSFARCMAEALVSVFSSGG